MKKSPTTTENPPNHTHTLLPLQHPPPQFLAAKAHSATSFDTETDSPTSLTFVFGRPLTANIPPTRPANYMRWSLPPTLPYLHSLPTS